MTRVNAWLAAAVAAVFAPNLIHLADAAIGSGSSDALKHVWSQWIVHQQLDSGEPLAMTTSLIHHPTGGAFFSLDTINAWLGWPLREWLGAVLTYNVVVILNVALAAWTAKTLAQSLDLDGPAQWLAGFSFAVSAWMLCFPLASGVSETAVVWPLPLIVLAARNTWHTPGWAWPVAGGVLLMIQGAACWSHGITAGLLLGGLGLANHRGLRSDPRRLLRFGVLFGTALAIAIPLYAAISGTVSADDAIKARTLSIFHSSPLSPLDVPEANSMALVDFFLPGSWGRRVSQAGTEQLMYAAYPGWVLLFLGSLAVRNKRPGSRLLLAGMAVFALLSMGPRVYLDHARTLGGVPNPVYLLAYWVVPLVNATIHSVDRFAVGVQLCAGLLAAIGLASCRASHRRIALVAVFCETLLVSPGKWPVPMVQARLHPTALHIGDRPGTGAVIDIPYLSGDGTQAWFNGDVFLQQTAHGRPIPFQLEGHGIETAHPTIAANPYFRSLSADRAPAVPCDGVAELRALNVEWIVLRAGASDAVVKSLDTCLTAELDAAGRRVFRLPSNP